MPGLEVAYRKFVDRVEEETLDPDWNVQHHPARAILERFSPLFGGWVAWLQEVLWLQQAGYPLAKDDLTIRDWKGLAILKRWHESGGPQEASSRTQMNQNDSRVF